MTYYVPNTGQGYRVGNHRTGLPYMSVHKASCQFLPEGTIEFDALVADKGEVDVRRKARVGRIVGCTFCQPEVLIEGIAPHERHERALALNETLCGCGHKYVSHVLGGGACQMETPGDWAWFEPVRCECTSFVAAEPVEVTADLKTAAAPGDVILPGAFTPGPVSVRMPDGKTTTGHVDADGMLTVTIPGHYVIRSGDEFSFGPTST